jgi:hypothetical protein
VIAGSPQKGSASAADEPDVKIDEQSFNINDSRTVPEEVDNDDA